jgi:hypothetical protein
MPNGLTKFSQVTTIKTPQLWISLQDKESRPPKTIVIKVDKPQLTQLSPRDYLETSIKRGSLPGRATKLPLKTRLASLRSKMLEKLSEGDMRVEPTLSNFLINMMLTPRDISMLMTFSHRVRRLASVCLSMNHWLLFSLPRTRKLARCNWIKTNLKN